MSTQPGISSTTRPARTRRATREVVRNLCAAAALAALTLAADAEAQGATAERNSSRGNMRIAVFDSRIILDSMPQRAAAESEFALEQTKARTMLNLATDSLRAALDGFQRVESQLSPRQREATMMHLRAREMMVEEMAANLDHVIVRRQAELQQPLRDRVREAVRAVRERSGYDVVLDRANEQIIVDASPRADITGEILRELRARKDIARLPDNR
jgi:Skp family chaperone for outer membrane proteins